MNIRFTVDELIDAFGATYRTIDIRSAAVKQGERWTNVYAIARLSYEEPEAAQERLCKLENDHGHLRTKSFRVVLGQRPFSDWGAFCQELQSGRINVADTVTHLAQSLDFAKELAYIQTDYSHIRPFDSYSWPVAQYPFFPYNTAQLLEDGCLREAARLGYPDPHEAVNLLCELNIRAGSSNGAHFWLSVPAFAMISGFAILPKENRMRVEIRRHRELAIKGNVVLKAELFGMGQPSKFRLAIESFSNDSDIGLLLTSKGFVDLPEIEKDDYAEVQILHPELGELHHSSNRVHALIPRAERNMLFEGLRFFCREAVFEKLLIRPFENKGPRLKESAAFELRTAWLLGLLGLSTIVLGEYEKIVVPETKFERGSVDIIAASQQKGMLVLVACTINSPTDADFANLLTTAEILSREVYAHTNVRILPLVCTAAPGYAQYVDSGNGLSGLPVLDADRLGIVLKLIKAGREREFFDFLENPKYSKLRNPD